MSSRIPAISRISFEDVITIEEFSGLAPRDLLSPEMDSKVSPYLFKLGMDVSKPFIVQPCKHRRMNGKVVLNWCYVGMERTDKEWLNCVYSSLEARITAQHDSYLRADMINASTEGMSWGAYQAMVTGAIGKEGMTCREVDDDEDDYKESLAMIQAMEALQLSVRGPLTVDEEVSLAGY